MITVGNFVQVKDGLLDPDFKKFDMTSWKGCVRDIVDEDIDDDDNWVFLIEIEWDVDTLNQLPKFYILDSINKGLFFNKMNLWSNEVFLIEKKDVNMNGVKRFVKNTVDDYLALDFDDDDKKYAQLLGTKDISVNKQNLSTFRKILLEKLEKTIVLTGRSYFFWEKDFVSGHGDSREYEYLKKKHPSGKDQFKLIKIFNANVGEGEDLIVKVQRLSDKKGFKLELSELKTIEKGTFSYELLDAYATWIDNY